MREARASRRVPKYVYDREPGEVTTRLEIEQWPRTWFGEEKILLHC